MRDTIENRHQIAESRRILEASAQEDTAYDVDILGLAFEVRPGVFSPKYFGSTPIFSRSMLYPRGGSFLEIGCGIGATAIMAAKNGANRVVAVDINPMAVENTQRNAERHGVSDVVEVRLSDMFSAIGPNESFDIIYWNMPFIYVSEPYQFRSMLERALFDPGYQITRKFLTRARKFLRPGGKVIVGFGDFGATELLLNFAKDAAYAPRVVASEDSQEGGPVRFVLYELVPTRLGMIRARRAAWAQNVKRFSERIMANRRAKAN